MLQSAHVALCVRVGDIPIFVTPRPNPLVNATGLLALPLCAARVNHADTNKNTGDEYTFELFMPSPGFACSDSPGLGNRVRKAVADAVGVKFRKVDITQRQCHWKPAVRKVGTTNACAAEL